jgi:membrane protein DedA with SNARE-associated domain
MWTTIWGLLTVALFVLTATWTEGNFNPLFMITGMTVACIFGFSLSVTLGRWKQERERKGSQPVGDERAPDASAELRSGS